jgi:hypothetical protein
MSYGYTRTELNRKLVIVPEEIEERAREETARNYIKTAYYKNLAEEGRERERARRVRDQSNFFAQHGTRDVKEEVGEEEQDRKLTGLRQSRRIFAKATPEEQQAAILEMSRLRDAKAKQEKAEYLAEQSRRWDERDRMKEDEKKLKKAKPFLARLAKTVAKTVAKRLDYDYDGSGGSKSKEILGKQRRIYKVAGSRKEHVKYKGQLIPVSDYKKLFKK